MAQRRRRSASCSPAVDGNPPKVVVMAKSEPAGPQQIRRGAFSKITSAGNPIRRVCLPAKPAARSAAPSPIDRSLQALVDGLSNDHEDFAAAFLPAASSSDSVVGEPENRATSDAAVPGLRVCFACVREGISPDKCTVATWATVESTPTALGGILCTEPSCEQAVCCGHALQYELPCRDYAHHRAVALAPAVTKLGEISRWVHAILRLWRFSRVSHETVLHETAQIVGCRLCECIPSATDSLVVGVEGVFEWVREATDTLLRVVSARKYVADAVEAATLTPDLKFHPDRILAAAITAPRCIWEDPIHIQEYSAELYGIVNSVLATSQLAAPQAPKRPGRLGKPAALPASSDAMTCGSSFVVHALVAMWLDGSQSERDAWRGMMKDARRFADAVLLQVKSGLAPLEVYASAATPLATVRALCPESMHPSLPRYMAAAIVLKCHNILPTKRAARLAELREQLDQFVDFFG